MVNLYRILIVTSIFLLFLSGCSKSSSHTISPLTTPIDTTFQSPTQAPPVPKTPVKTPTQDHTLGRIEGTISRKDFSPRLLSATLFLGDPSGSKPFGAFITVNPNQSPQGYFVENDRFIFPNVPPGPYAIVFWMPDQAYIVPDSETGYTKFITITNNESLDVGEIAVP